MIRHLVIAIVSSIALSSFANAADMYAPGPAGGYKDWGPIETWAGLYAGVNGGWAWGTEIDLNAATTCPTFNTPGITTTAVVECKPGSGSASQRGRG
jgi:hypothetical protein